MTTWGGQKIDWRPCNPASKRTKNWKTKLSRLLNKFFNYANLLRPHLAVPVTIPWFLDSLEWVLLWSKLEVGLCFVQAVQVLRIFVRAVRARRAVPKRKTQMNQSLLMVNFIIRIAFCSVKGNIKQLVVDFMTGSAWSLLPAKAPNSKIKMKHVAKYSN